MRIFRHYIFTIICTAAILLLSLMPIPEVPTLEAPPFIDKWAHFLMYGCLMLCLWLDWTRKRLRPTFGCSLSAIFCSIVLGGIIELIQPSVGRSGEWLDFYADTFGTILGFLLGFIVSPLLSKCCKDS